jgi:hypothetical protein
MQIFARERRQSISLTRAYVRSSNSAHSMLRCRRPQRGDEIMALDSKSAATREPIFRSLTLMGFQNPSSKERSQEHTRSMCRASFFGCICPWAAIGTLFQPLFHACFQVEELPASAALDTLCQRLSPLYKELGWVSLAGLELSHFNPLLTNLSPRRIRFDGWQKFTSGISFQEVPLRSIAQSCAYYLGVRVLS